MRSKSLDLRRSVDADSRGASDGTQKGATNCADSLREPMNLGVFLSRTRFQELETRANPSGMGICSKITMLQGRNEEG